MLHKLLLLVICFCATSFSLLAQGCSDAGFCSINALKPTTSLFQQGEATESTPKNQFKTGMSYGRADNQILAVANYVEYNRQISEKLSTDIKLTSLWQTGNGISTWGVGDLFVNVNYRPIQRLSFTIGTKIPLQNADNQLDNVPLPMDYQASLGTLDLIVGVGYSIQKWQFLVGYQQPLTQNNNRFVAANFSPTSPLSSFQTTNRFNRSGDVLLRIAYPFQVGKKISITPSVLPIYHLANDGFVDGLGQEIRIRNSAGLTLNLNGIIDFQVSPKSSLQLLVAMPVVVRPSRPDGLTRSFLVNLEYSIRF
ncbi:MAG TPA: hypothetical protein DCM08_01065 [Microscillaceae bacterium]|jgi:hypothetical protein|nr:hypothetical protein [Microscillaceae bacterium]